MRKVSMFTALPRNYFFDLFAFEGHPHIGGSSVAADRPGVSACEGQDEGPLVISSVVEQSEGEILQIKYQRQK